MAGEGGRQGERTLGEIKEKINFMVKRDWNGTKRTKTLDKEEDIICLNISFFPFHTSYSTK